MVLNVVIFMFSDTVLSRGGLKPPPPVQCSQMLRFDRFDLIDSM